jgi:RNA polymerase sigma factor (sigma-70 family)
LGKGGVDRSKARNDMSTDPPAVEDDNEGQDVRDRRLLDRIADARARDDEIGCLRERTAMGELLAPYWSEVRRIVGWRLASISPDPTDVEDISSKVIEHIIKKLKKTTDLGGAPLRVIVFLDAQTRAIDYWRARTRRNSRLSDFGGKIPEVPAREEVTLAHAEVMAEIIKDLAPRDQRILVERYVAGLTPQEIADGLGVSREVVDTAYSRALAKLRVHPRVIAVRNRMREAV